MSNAYRARVARGTKREITRKEPRKLGKVLQQAAAIEWDDCDDGFAEDDNDLIDIGLSSPRPRGME